MGTASQDITSEDYFKVFTEGLRQRLNKKLIDQLTQELLADFEKHIRMLIKEEAEKLTLESIKGWKDVAQWEDRIAVLFKYTPEEDGLTIDERKKRYV